MSTLFSVRMDPQSPPNKLKIFPNTQCPNLQKNPRDYLATYLNMFDCTKVTCCRARLWFRVGYYNYRWLHNTMTIKNTWTVPKFKV